MTPPDERRLEPRSIAKGRGLVVSPGRELPGLIVDQSNSGCRLRLDRNLALPNRILLIDMAGAKTRMGEKRKRPQENRRPVSNCRAASSRTYRRCFSTHS